MNRFGTISSTDLRRASDQLSSLQRGWHQILPIDELRDRAADLIDTYPLRSADALQLAAALTWCQKRPVRRTFITADIRLAEAATLAGFTVVTP